jgi:hypothetical protein
VALTPQQRLALKNNIGLVVPQESLAREAAEAAKTADEAKKAAVTAAHEAASLTAPLRKLEWLKPRADAELAFADKALAAAKTDQAKARAWRSFQAAIRRSASSSTCARARSQASVVLPCSFNSAFTASDMRTRS